jgi:alpha-beta hydrolase superfamily lysophospholipase
LRACALASRETKEETGMESTRMERLTLRAEDGFTLAVVRWLPVGAPRAVIHVSHGMAEHAARYGGFAEACAAVGIAVYGHDHRGHGGSIDDSTPLGHYADEGGWAKVVGDLHAVNRHIHASHPNTPVFLFGHSMGSFVARAYLLDHADAVAGAIISATGWRLGTGNRILGWAAERQARKLGTRTPSALMSKLVFGTFNFQFRPRRSSFDWLSRDNAEVDKYVEDPLCGFECSGTLWRDLFAGVYQLEQDENRPERLSKTLPILFVAGSKDPVSMGGFGNGQLAKRYIAAGNTKVTDRRYPEGRHELVNETNRSEIFTDVIAWVKEHIPARPGAEAKAVRQQSA